MRATTVKQIKFNRGQVSDLLSERMDMGLQNACGTVYDNVYINRYGQIQSAPHLLWACNSPAINSNVAYPVHIVGMFDSGGDKVFPVGVGVGDNTIVVYGALSKSNPYATIDTTTPRQVYTLSTPLTTMPTEIKFYQFGYNVILFNKNQKPILLNITPQDSDWLNITLTVKENYFDNSFNNIYSRGLNTDIPSDFSVPTSGAYIIEGKQITTKLIAKVKRNGAGGAFTQSLVGQVINSPANGGVLQVRSVEDGDTLYAYIMSPFVALSSTATDIRIPWAAVISSGLIPEYKYDSAKWLFGYEKVYGDTAGPNGTISYPDSAVYKNQRLIFGGNDYHGSLISASRIGVINDFDPESGTESDAFTVGISSKDFCRIVDFVVSNNELRIACTNGEYAMSLANLTPSGSLSGFDLRSEVGIEPNTAICDCGGITAYISQDKNAVYGTQFSLLRDRYQPISLTSQTSNIVNNGVKLLYLTNRPNNEGNCLVGLNKDSSVFVGGIDLNAGLIGLSRIKSFKFQTTSTKTQQLQNLFCVGNALWGIISEDLPGVEINNTGIGEKLVRFSLNECFDLPCWANGYPATHPNTLTVTKMYGDFLNALQQDSFRALYKNGTEYIFITPTGYTQNSDNTYTINFEDDIDPMNIVCAGFVRQTDWRSVEIGMGMATRELNKRIVKLEGVIEPTQVTGSGSFAGLVLTPEESKNFITLTRSKDIEPMDVDNLSNTSYTENQDLVWRRAFDNPDREMHYGVSFIAPFLVKSITATVEYDEAN